MSNKFEKNIDATKINENDPAIVKLLKKRLEVTSKDDPKRNYFNSSIIYFFLEIFMLYLSTSLDVNLEPKYITAFLLVTAFISLYNIVVSVIQIFKYKYRKYANIVLIIFHLFILLASLVFYF